MTNNWQQRIAQSGFVLLMLASGFTSADGKAAPISAKKLYFSCSSCHGEHGEGSAPIHAPPIAGQLPAYLSKQLRNFRDGIRGANKGDKYGQQMALMAANLRDNQAIDALAEFAAVMPLTINTQSVSGDIARGKGVYAQCVACHGATGTGNDALLAPRLAGIDDWYLLQQLKHFRSGVRGYALDDVYGKQMRAAVEALDDDALRDVVAYINALKVGAAE